MIHKTRSAIHPSAHRRCWSRSRSSLALKALLVSLGCHLTARAEAPSAPVSMPELLKPLAPEYPTTGKGNARVVLRVTLDAQGQVTAVEVASGNEPYASAAVRAAEQGVFTPARRGEVPIPAKILVAVDFTFSSPKPAGKDPAATTKAPQAPAAPPSATPATTADAEALSIIVVAPRIDETERGIERAEARLMAGTFGDPLRAVELLPGVTPLISGVPYFFVRGAPAGSVGFYIDEAKVPQLYHVGPGSSVMHPLFVEAVALHSGPYRARYGDATSGVITTRVVTDVPEASAEAEAKMFESSVYAGTPTGRGSVAVGGKVSHLGPILQLINPKLRLNYWDYQSLTSYHLSARDQVSLLVFGAGDFVGQEQLGNVDIKIDSTFHRAKVGYQRNLARGVDLDSYAIVGIEGSRFGDANEEFKAQSVGAGTTLSFGESDAWQWASGASIEAKNYDTGGASNFVGETNNISVTRVDTQAALWAEASVTPVHPVNIDAGLRVAGYQSVGNRALAFEPRLTSTLKMSERWKSILAIGYSTQAPTSAVPAPAVRPAGLSGGIQQALQRALTVRYAVPLVFTGEITGFYNEYLSLSDPLSLSTVPDPLMVGSTPEGGEPPTEDLNFDLHPNGRALGLEFLVRRPFSNALSGTLAYTVSHSTRHIGSEDVPSSFDRTHIVNTTLGYNLGSGYHLSTRFLAYSGLPVRKFGDTQGRTGDRSEPFLRWDLRFSKSWKTSWSDLMLIVEMLNATFQDEVLGISCFATGCVTAKFGPITVPSIGLRGTFGGARSEEPKGAAFE
ncbi:MAG: TonB family protein [Polyangiaceae bacterium]|nr:TonB family protein [Polyangiaceae bacterium]